MEKEVTIMIFFKSDLPNSKAYTVLILSSKELKTFHVYEQTPQKEKF